MQSSERKHSMESIRSKLIDVVGGDRYDNWEQNRKDFAKKATKFTDAQCLPLGLLFAFIISIIVPVIGAYFDQLGFVSTGCIVLIFVISGLKLKTDEGKEALTSYRAMTFGLCSILLVTPMIGILLAQMIPLNPDFKLGLAIFIC